MTAEPACERGGCKVWRRSHSQKMGQIVAVGVVGSAQLLLDVHVDVHGLLAVQRRPSLHGRRVRLHVRRLDGGRRAHAERRVRVRQRRAAVMRRSDRSDGRGRVLALSLVHWRKWLRGPRVLRVNDGADGVVRGRHHGNFDGHYDSQCFRTEYVSIT